jgi:anaerobic selenocysteine-containing dehydrogenase
MVSVDFYLNETTRHAQVILPPTCTLEHDHYDLVFHLFAVRNTARYSTALFPRPEHARHDHEIFEGVGKRLAEKMGKSWEPFMDPATIVDMGLRFGPYGMSRTDGGAPLDLATLEKEPHGVDLGPLASSLPARLYHADKKIVAMPDLLRDEVRRFASELATAPTPNDSLVLIGRRHVRSNNSWLHNTQRLMKGPTRHELLMHPDDARARGLSSGARVRVRSRTGDVVVEMVATDEMMPGVVSLPHGFGHDRSGIRLSIASTFPGASNNDLTDETRLDVSGNAALNGVPVTVEAV